MTAKKLPKILQRGSDSWRVQVELTPDPVTGTRRRRYLTVRGTRKDAEKALTSAEYERDHGVDIAPERLTVKDLLDRWQRDYAAVTVAQSTQQRYRSLARGIVEVIGGERAQSIRPAHVQKTHAALIARGLALRTVLHHHRVLREALGWAVRMQLLSVNVADAVSPPRPPRTEMLALDGTGVSAVLDACPTDELRSLVFVAVQTGLRLGELTALRWSDVDSAHGRASINRSLSFAGGMHLKAPKTNRGRRAIALSPATVTALRAHKAAQNETKLKLGSAYADGDLVFASALGEPLKPWSVGTAFQRAAKKAGAPKGIRFHDLRHTAATLALGAGVHPKIVSERLGHASIQITLDIYSHVLPNMQEAAAAAMDAFIRMPDTKARSASGL